jgi:uncharacterized protein YoxC
MDQSLLLVIGIAFGIVIGLLIFVLIELKRTVRMIKPSLEEFEQTMRNLRKITDDVNSVTDSIKTVSSGASNFVNDVRKMFDLLNDISSDTVVRLLGFKVGIRTALDVLLNNLFQRKEDKNNEGK